MDSAALEKVLDLPVESVHTTPYEYRTSHSLEVVDVLLRDGNTMELLLKHLGRSGLDANARLAKPEHLHEPQREIEAYGVLEHAKLGTATCYAAGPDWLLLEKVRGVELWQVGDMAVWANVARWLSRMHRLFSGQQLTAPHFIDYEASLFRRWVADATAREPRLKQVADRCSRAIELLQSQTRTLVHGEFYPSNVLVAGERVVAVDWEMTGTGPGVLDLAALITGLPAEDRETVVAAYGDAGVIEIDAARLLLAAHWIGRAGWTPPREHARDWFREAAEAAERLET